MGHSIADTGSRESQQRSDKFGGTGKRGALACMVNTEVGAVLAVMRRNARWSGQYDSDDHLEHSLIHSLKSLREEIFCWQHEWNKINPLLYLKPFLDVIRSDETGAPITGVALSAIYKILVMEVFDLNTDNVYDGMHSIVDAVTGCRFEVTDSASEEVVLMKILQVLLACMKSKNSVILSDQDVCTIMTTCFRVVRQAGTKGELLQRSARHTMNELVRSVFLRLSDFDGVAGDESCSESLFTVDNCHELVDGIERVRNTVGPNGKVPCSTKYRHDVIKFLKDVVDFHGEVVLLVCYSIVNFTGMVKILKKCDKRTGGVLRIEYMQKVLEQPFFAVEQVFKMVKDCEKVMQELFAEKEEEEPPIALEKKPEEDENGLLAYLRKGDLNRRIEAARRSILEMRKGSSTYSPFSLPPLHDFL